MQIYFSHRNLKFNYKNFTFTLGLGNFTLIFLAGLLSGALSYWQVQRGDLKAQHLAQWEEQGRHVASEITRLEDMPEDYRPIVVVGTYDTEHPFFLDNQHLNGRFGHYVFVPLVLASTHEVLIVNRGFVPIDVRDRLPALETPGDVQTVHGILSTPMNSTLIKETFDPSIEPWPARVEKLDLVEICEKMQTKCHHQVLRADQNDTPYQAVPMPVQSFLPERHYAYALQWLGIGLAGIIIIIIFCTRRNS